MESPYKNTKHYDIIVIGSGGGTKIARPAANLGKKVAIIEKDKLGGTCLNRGCIPSKMLIHPANIMYEIKEAKKFNISVVEKPTIDFGKLTSEILETTSNTSNSIKEAYESGDIENLDFYNGHAKFLADKLIEVNGQKLSADLIFLGTGARPNKPPIENIENTPYMTSTQALYNKELPRRLIVIGGGYIGVELGAAYGAMGSEVHFITRGGLIGRVDSEIRKEFTKEFEKHYTIHESIVSKKIEYDKETKEFTLFYEQNGLKKTLSSDGLLVATGVKPNTDNLGLGNTNIELTKRGFFKIDDKLQTTVKGIFALGDAAGNFMFRHSANFEGEYLFEEIVEKNLKEPQHSISYPPMPWAIFSNPQVAGVGKTEDELKKDGVEYIKGLNHYKNSAMGDALRSDCGFVKLLFAKESQKLIGVQIIGEQASNMVHQLIVHITFGHTLDDLLKIIYIHPALNENVRNAARKAKEEFKKTLSRPSLSR